LKVGFSDVDRSNQLWIQPLDLDMPF